jgi:hypothetical protein
VSDATREGRASATSARWASVARWKIRSRTAQPGSCVGAHPVGSSTVAAKAVNGRYAVANNSVASMPRFYQRATPDHSVVSRDPVVYRHVPDRLDGAVRERPEGSAGLAPSLTRQAPTPEMDGDVGCHLDPLRQNLHDPVVDLFLLRGRQLEVGRDG